MRMMRVRDWIPLTYEWVNKLLGRGPKLARLLQPCTLQPKQQWGWACVPRRHTHRHTPIHPKHKHTPLATQIHTHGCTQHSHKHEDLSPHPAASMHTCIPTPAVAPSWTHRPLSPAPTPGAALRAPDTHTCTHQRAPQTGTELTKEFHERSGQTALTSYRTWPAKNVDHPASSQTLLCPYPAVFPDLVLRKASKPIPLPASSSSPKYTIRSSVQSHNALPLHPLLCPVS